VFWVLETVAHEYATYTPVVDVWNIRRALYDHGRILDSTSISRTLREFKNGGKRVFVPSEVGVGRYLFDRDAFNDSYIRLAYRRMMLNEARMYEDWENNYGSRPENRTSGMRRAMGVRLS
jgi:hypothetical protein